jgi:hypothetical protein
VKSPWVVVVLGAWSLLPEDVQWYILEKIQQGLGLTFETFADFYDWIVSDPEDLKIVADYINQTLESPDAILQLAPAEAADRIPSNEKDALARRWRKRNAPRNNDNLDTIKEYARNTPTRFMGLSDHHIEENARTALVSRMQSMFNARGIMATRQLQADLKAFTALSMDELDGAISAIETIR